MDKPGEVYLNLIFSGVIAFAWLSVTTFCLARLGHGQWARLGLFGGLLGLAQSGLFFAARAQAVLADNRDLAMKLAEGHIPTILNGCAAGGILLLVLAVAASHLDTLRV